jgi:membrane associated rhomboid family serine protease
MQRDSPRPSDSPASHARTPAGLRSLLATSGLALLAVFVVWAASYPAAAAAAVGGAVVALLLVGLVRRDARGRRHGDASAHSRI